MGQADNPWTVLGLERTGDMQATVAFCSGFLRTAASSVLGKLIRTAVVQAVKRQWRSLAKQFHPDL